MYGRAPQTSTLREGLAATPGLEELLQGGSGAAVARAPAPIAIGYTLLNQLSALVLIVLLSPLLLWLGWCIWREDGAPVLFRQPRVGHGGQLFRCYKFRTMQRDAEAQLARWKREDHPLWHEYVTRNFKLRSDPRVLRCGAFIRRLSLDELPQLINVLNGRMHLVGPRPLIPSEVEHYGPTFGLYCSVKPGITGLWQIGGRSETAFQDRVALDAQYVRRRSAVMDFVILLKTALVLWRSRGAY